MSGAVRFLRPRRNLPPGRPLVCNGCGTVIDSVEIDLIDGGQFVNPRTFRCYPCNTANLMRELPVPFSEQHPPRRAA